MLYRLYIGSNNKTGKVETEKAVKLISLYYAGFTAYKAVGMWQGKGEKSLIVEISTEKAENNKISGLCKALAVKLNQQAIGLLKQSQGLQFIS